MRKLALIAALFFSAVGAAGISLAASPARYPVELNLTVQGQDTHKALLLPAKKGFSYEVSEQLTDIAVLRVFNSEGKALDGYFEITIEELHEMLNRKIDAGLKATSSESEIQKCESCRVVDGDKPLVSPSSDRRPAVMRPTPVPLSSPKKSR